jgi:diguanylate cyclase (GGDEF)-like protein/PAS domain S-box-containing protein
MNYRTLFNSIDKGFCLIEVVFDEQGVPDDIRCLEMNPAFEQQSILVGAEDKTIRELVHDTEPLWREIYGKVAMNGEPTRFVKEVKAMNRWFDVYCFRLGEPETRKVAVLFSDITAHKQAQEQVRLSKIRYRQVFESARDGLLILDAVTQQITDANPLMMELLGYSRDEILNKELWEIGLMKDAVASQAAFQELQQNGYIRYEDLSFETKDGNRCEVEFTGNVYIEDDHQVILFTFRDVTERKAAREIIRQGDELLQGIFDSVATEVAVVDASGIITHVSKSWERFATKNEAVMGRVGVGMNYLDVCGEAGDEDLLAKKALEGIRAVIEGRQPAFHLEYPCHSPSEQRWFKMQVDPRSPAVGGAVITHIDITESKLAADRIAYDAYHDGLTGLINRALFIEHLHQAITHAQRHKDYLYAVLFLDLDRFKFINDTLGHAAGDRFLVHVARKLESVVRPGDVVARLSGDEFAILLSDIKSITDATRVAKRINQELDQPSHLAEHNLLTTASIGITISKLTYTSTEQILREADIAMYRAKASGRGCYQVFDPSMESSITALLKLETDLRLAIEREEFCLHYQPIVSLKDNWITGFEALVRWQHPERGLVLPDEFIPIAEETGLILPIGKWVLHEACRQMREWQDSSGFNMVLSISVNLSAKEFSQVNLIRQITGVLTETGLSASNLKLEITESAVMEKSQTAATTLEQFKDLGVKLHIDDFGVGYSSLSNLHTYPVNVLKIDRSFVKRMGPGGKSSEIVQTIVQLAHNLGMEVTAEGVETIDQLRQLRALGCEYGQGYHFSKPVNSEKAKRLIGN